MRWGSVVVRARFLSVLGSALMLSFFVLAPMVKAAQPLTFSVNHSENDGITTLHIQFEAADTPQFQTGKVGSTLFIRFREEYAAKTTLLTAKLKPYITSASSSQDHKAINIVFNQPFMLKRQTQGVDIILGNAKSSVQSHSKAAQTSPAEFAELEPSAGPEEPNNDNTNTAKEEKKEDKSEGPLPEATEAASPKPVVRLVPPASTLRAIEKQKKIAQLQSKKRPKKTEVIPSDAPQKAVAEKKNTPARPPKDQAVTSKETKAITPQALKSSTAPPAPTTVAPPKPIPEKNPVVEQLDQDKNTAPAEETNERAILQKGISQDTMRINAWDQLAKGDDEKEDPTSISIDQYPYVTIHWDQLVSLAVFERAPYTWIVFDAYKHVDLSDFNHQLPHIKDIKQIVDKHYTIIRIQHDAPLHVETRHKGNDWKLYFLPQAKAPGRILTVKPLNQVKHRAGSYIPVANTGQIIRMVDPDIGDNIVIVPLPYAEVGIASFIQSVDYSILPSAQGLAIIAHNEEVTVEQDPTGVMIESPSLQPYIELQQKAQVDAEINQYEKQHLQDGLMLTSTLLPFPIPKAENKASFLQGLDRLNQKLNTIPDPKDRLGVHFDIARWYAQNDFNTEALGVLNYIKSFNTPLSLQKTFLMLHGALAYRLHDFPQASQDFSLLRSMPLSFKEQQEVTFWDGLTQLEQRQPGTDLPYVQYREDFLRLYPQTWRIPLGLASAQWALSLDDGGEKAKAVIDNLLEEKGADTPINDIKFMKAQLLMKQKEWDEAKTILQELMGDAKDRLNRARAEYNFIRIQLDLKQIDSSKAAERLEHLVFVWREPDFEGQILRDIGQLYVDDKHYEKGMQSWKQFVTFYPESEYSLSVSRQLSETFQFLFKDGGADRLSDIDALSLYYKFREWQPIGSVGDEITRKLATRLSRVDLIPEAILLLEHQTQYRLSGAEKDHALLELAHLYLLEKKSDKAIETLDKIAPTAEEDILRQARYLRAESYINLGRGEDAKALLDNDPSEKSNLLRSEIFWRQRNWVRLVATLEQVLMRRHLQNTLLNQEESDLLMRLSLGYAMTGHEKGLSIIKERYQPHLDTTLKTTQIINYLIEVPKPIRPKELEKTLGLDNIENFWVNYKKTLANPT
ncbi:MAG: hypothetical protein IPP74_05320 [Alphaproteobacteria bacterium]|nr:hypothetical protein [Alphaproteobacteria bacterium]